MTILVVPDGFKDSLTSQEVSDAICDGIMAYDSDTKIHSIYASDGGDGFLNVVKYYKPDLAVVSSKTVDPLGREIEAEYLWNDNTKAAYIELAAASGIELLLKDDRKVTKTSTLGTGLQIREAILKGAKTIYVALGGSATNDAGTGIAAGLGYRFLDHANKTIAPCGENLKEISRIIPPPARQHFPEVYAINDVKNPLFGPEGAAYVYAKQKGANPDQIVMLDQGLQNINQVVKQELYKDAAQLGGAGAAGGSAYGLHVFCGAIFKPGAQFVLGLTQFDTLLSNKEVDLIITGEGMIDSQTKNGKLVSGVVNQAQKYAIPVMAVCGRLQLSHKDVKQIGLSDAIQIYDPKKPKEYSYINASALISEAVNSMLSRNF